MTMGADSSLACRSLAAGDMFKSVGAVRKKNCWTSECSCPVDEESSMCCFIVTRGNRARSRAALKP